MKEFWNMIQMVFTMLGGWLGYFLGGCDGLLFALVVFVVMDYITGLMCAVADKNLSSEVGFRDKRLFDADSEAVEGIIKIKCPTCKGVIAVCFKNKKVRAEKVSA